MSEYPMITRQMTRLQESHAKNKLAHALLFLADKSTEIQEFILQLSMMLLCRQTNAPCRTCQACQLIMIDSHPDITKTQPEKAGGMIKIDQIRELTNTIFTSPQLGNHRIVILQPADSMNHAAANALLKILEEPPDGVYFFLTARHLSTIPPTIISRCQLWRLSDTSVHCQNYLEFGTRCPGDKEMERVFSDRDQLIQDLDGLSGHRHSVCSLAAEWSKYELKALLAFLYLLNAQIIAVKLHQTTALPTMSSIANRLQLTDLFKQIDKINTIVKKINHTINVNQLLSLETILSGYMP
ncbi:DNA polymerase III subunit delta' C-terminal domain-containing protein [Legionella spiritensis]|uniref:DNA polymerase III subunit delta' C-terminal domain-containing protein n=1 Tax=Legionella spiritensis TaxID=452 RepID=UPI000F6CEFF8|nr:DNA polymerase III subunit delta' C-terminal domain-containing protein [Legionella spiritensis]VEG90062.1 DNA polymerase III, delta prime subunit [Legionella spiritensis]